MKEVAALISSNAIRSAVKEVDAYSYLVLAWSFDTCTWTWLSLQLIYPRGADLDSFIEACHTTPEVPCAT